MHFASDNLLKVIRELLLPSLVQLQLLILLLKPLLKLCYGGLAGPGEADLADQLEAPAFKSLTSFSACCLGGRAFLLRPIKIGMLHISPSVQAAKGMQNRARHSHVQRLNLASLPSRLWREFAVEQRAPSSHSKKRQTAVRRRLCAV